MRRPKRRFDDDVRDKHDREQIFADLRDFDRSRQLNQEGLAICREIGDREGIIWRCGRLAQIAYAQRDT